MRGIKGICPSNRGYGAQWTDTELRCLMAEALISSDPRIMMGKPTVAGTRITVELILEKLAAGESVEQILSEHPRLTVEGVRAAIGFAKGSHEQDRLRA